MDDTNQRVVEKSHKKKKGTIAPEKMDEELDLKEKNRSKTI